MDEIKDNDKITPLQLVVIIILSVLVFFGATRDTTTQQKINQNNEAINGAEELSLSNDASVILPVKWNDIGKRMVDVGIIDKEKFEAIYIGRGGMNEEMADLLYKENNKELKMTQENAGYLLNLLWAFGIANKNPVLEDGPMRDAKYGGAGNFASTGGWDLAVGDTMNHYSRHSFVILSDEQQALIEDVSKNIYRPCCGNSTYFPDCNHGMAMLGLLELLASNGVGEEEMYKIALKVNSYWFPETYNTITAYLHQNGLSLEDVSPKEILGEAYSSVSGYRRILSLIKTQPTQGGGGCGV